MYEQIASNKRRSALLVILFFGLIAFLAWMLGEATGMGRAGFILAVLISLVMTLASYAASDTIVLAISRAKPARKEDYPHLVNVVEGLTIAAGLPQPPRCYIIDDTAPNAFAAGRNPQHAVICVTTGLLDKLDRAELEGVIAHEMSHIKNYDVRLQTLVVVMVGIVALLSDWILRGFFWGGRRRGGGRKGGGAAVFILIGLVLAVLSPLIARLIQFAVSRRREFLADADGALLTRYPPGLASALRKIAADTEPLEAANKATAHLYIVNPLKNVKGAVNRLFSTHPPIEERIAALEKM
ncbi:MAG: M48 family metallopeptidase [Candidatus Aminicenantes bacterium]|nr:M48 family metallopeptidase [Candidatus Aminicenantes bacterium]